MGGSRDIEYYRGRARTARAMAANATDPAAAAAHVEMAKRYEALGRCVPSHAPMLRLVERS